jgi:hypothetical protein
MENRKCKDNSETVNGDMELHYSQNCDITVNYGMTVQRTHNSQWESGSIDTDNRSTVKTSILTGIRAFPVSGQSLIGEI